jgi:hypothetical protein
VLNRLGEYFKGDALSERTLLPKSDFAAAVNDIRNHWEQLQLYTTNGLIPIDNNDVEQLMKQVATGRKNWRAPDVPRRTSGRSPPRDALLTMFILNRGCLVSHCI